MHKNANLITMVFSRFAYIRRNIFHMTSAESIAIIIHIYKNNICFPWIKRHSATFTEVKIDYSPFPVINYLPLYNNFPRDEMLIVSRYTIAISMANVQTSDIPYFTQFSLLLLGDFLIRTHGQLILIPFVFYW